MGGAYLVRFVTNTRPPSETAVLPPRPSDTEIKIIVERIIAVESTGDSNAKNKRSSATGAGQFLDDTWIEMLQTHRRDLVRRRSANQGYFRQAPSQI
jgi:hypothetical protein